MRDALPHGAGAGISPAVLKRFHLHRPLRVVKAATIPLVIAGVMLSTLHQSSLGSLFLIVPPSCTPIGIRRCCPYSFLFPPWAWEWRW